MSWPIWIGVDCAGRPLVGAINVNYAMDSGELHDVAQVYPSQLRFRIAVFYPTKNSTRRGTAPRSSRGGASVELSGSWVITTRTEAREQIARGIDVRGFDNPDHEFPRANPARSSRRKVQR